MLEQPQTEILPDCLCGESRSLFNDLIPFTRPLALAQRSLTVAASEKHQETTHLGDEGEQPAVLNQNHTRPCFPKRERVSMHRGFFLFFIKWNTAPPRSILASAVRCSHRGTNKGEDGVVRGSLSCSTVILSYSDTFN